MARNAEKAMTALARWRRMKEQEERGPVARRPMDTKECNKLADAERFRREILGDISKKIAQIQNPGLGEYKLRDLNDEINRLLKLKYAWECRIKELGGADYKRLAPRELDSTGQGIYGNKGYLYFGAAKDLPGVRELFEKAAEEGEQKEKKRGDLLKNVDADYYGYMDDDDGLLIPLERTEEQRARKRLEEEWKEKGASMNRWDDMDDEMYKVDEESDEEFDVKESVVIGDDGKEMVIKHVMVPSQKEIEEMVVERKKQYLMSKFVG